MRVIIAGGGRLGMQLATALLAGAQEVTVIDSDRQAADEIASSGPLAVICDDACQPEVLEEAGALRADVLVACTGSDEDNLVISFLAKRYFDVPRVVARINLPDNDWLFDERWGVDVAVSASSTLLALIQEATGGADTIDVAVLRRAGIHVIETTLTPAARAVGRTLSAIAVPPGCLVTTVVRDGHPHVPGGGFALAAGDEIVIVCDHPAEADINAVFQGSNA